MHLLKNVTRQNEILPAKGTILENYFTKTKRYMRMGHVVPWIFYDLYYFQNLIKMNCLKTILKKILNPPGASVQKQKVQKGKRKRHEVNKQQKSNFARKSAETWVTRMAVGHLHSGRDLARRYASLVRLRQELAGV